MFEIPLPTPPPMPGPLPDRIVESDLPLQGEDRRLHRLAQLHDACPRCAPGPEDQDPADWLRSLASARPTDHVPHFDHWLTPEGELAGFDHGEFDVDRPLAFAEWADRHFPRTGPVWAHVVDVNGVAWTRAVFWLDHDRLKMQAASGARWFHLEQVFERLWPPVHPGFRATSAFHGRDLARQIHEHPPAEVSAYTRLTFRPGTGVEPAWMRDVSHVIPWEDADRDDP